MKLAGTYLTWEMDSLNKYELVFNVGFGTVKTPAPFSLIKLFLYFYIFANY